MFINVAILSEKMKYVFVFGRDPELSFLELVSYMGLRKIDYRLESRSGMAALVDVNEADFKSMMPDLGGTLKIAKVIDDTETLYLGSSNVIKYAVSDYGCNNILKVKSSIKARLKKEGLKAMLRKSKRKLEYLSPTEVREYHLLEDGVEIIAYKDAVAKTIACFNPEEHEKRDGERPCNRYGEMVSIRLAKILINLAARKGDIVLDPFCGYGVILQEAMLMGFDVIGVDIDKDCVIASVKNCDWTRKKYRLDKQFQILHGDSTRLSQAVKRAGCIATEPYLGPMLRERPTRDMARRTVGILEQLYSKALKEFKKVTTGNIAIVMPRFRLQDNSIVSMDFERLVKEAGLKIARISPEIKLPVVYTAPNSIIEREIWIISA